MMLDTLPLLDPPEPEDEGLPLYLDWPAAVEHAEDDVRRWLERFGEAVDGWIDGAMNG